MMIMIFSTHILPIIKDREMGKLKARTAIYCTNLIDGTEHTWQVYYMFIVSL